MVTGLAWTDVGGELLTIEAAMMPGKGRMTVTGNLRDVMKESISAAASYVRSRAIAFGIEPPQFDKRDIHVHVPEGATPKDGPSAGVAMVTAIVSVMAGIPVRRDVAMTGEITLRGRVLPIGGLKEKLLAALRGGIKTVLIPEENAKDLVEISDQIKGGLEIIPVSRMDEVLALALTRKPEPIEWDENAAKSVDVPEPVSRTTPRRSSRTRLGQMEAGRAAPGAALSFWPRPPPLDDVSRRKCQTLEGKFHPQIVWDRVFPALVGGVGSAVGFPSEWRPCVGGAHEIRSRNYRGAGVECADFEHLRPTCR